MGLLQILPIRQLADVGVVTDQPPSSLPPQAFTRAKNVRFDEGAIVRSPIFRSVKTLELTVYPELVTNGTFTTDVSGWTIVSGAFNKTPSGAQLKENGGPPGPHVYQAITTVIGETYQLTGDIIDGTCDGAISVSTSTDTSVARIASSSTAAGNVSVDFTFTAVGTTTYVLLESKGTVSYNAFVYFDNISVKKTTYDLQTISPRHTYGITTDTGYNTVLVVSDTFEVLEYSNGALTSVFTGSETATNARVTTTHLANQVYINRDDRVPVYRSTSGSTFAALPNWGADSNNDNTLDITWKCSSLRAYGDFLIALNVTEGGTTFANRIRFSDLTLANTVPTSWDASDTTKSAGFIDLVEMKTPIVDGLPLGNNFIIYSKDQVWSMEFIGGAFIMNTRKLFADAGVINHNCVVEVENRHYVFSTSDIYTHDGNTRQSLVDSRVRDFIFDGMDTSSFDKCFVQHNPDLNEIYFCYKSGDDMVEEFKHGSYCNRAAAFNYQNNTWSFVDLPNVSSGTVANVKSSLNYDSPETATLDYDSVGGSYQSQEAGFDSHTLFVGHSSLSDGITHPKLYALDGAETGTLSFPRDSDANTDAFIERVGLDLDELSQLSGYKIISSILPQITTPSTDKSFSFAFGAANLISSSPIYEATVTFDATTDYKIDSRASGRYLSYKMTSSDFKDFKFTGFDADVAVTGRR